MGFLKLLKALRLIRKLKHHKGSVRSKAAEVLGNIGNSRAIDPLIKVLLNDEDFFVRASAAEALGKIGDPRAVEALIDITKDKYCDEIVLKEAVEALGKIGDSRAIEQLIFILRYGSVWDLAAKALAKMGGNPTIKLLIPILSSKNVTSRYRAAITLEKIGWKAKNATEKAIFAVARQDWNECIALGEETIDSLIFALKYEDSNIRDDVLENAAEALLKIGRSAVKPLINILLDKDVDLKKQKKAAEVLGKIGDPRAVESLINMLPNIYAVEALKKIGGSYTIELLIPILKSEDASIRKSAATILDELGWIAQTITQKASYMVAKRNWNECISLGEPAVEPLIIALKDKNTDVQNEAIETLGKIGDPRAVAGLINILPNFSAAMVLGKIGDPRAIEPLFAMLKDNYDTFRHIAATSLDELGWKAQTASEKAIYLVAKRNWNECVALGEAAIEPLIFALSDRFEYVRKEAVKTLGEIGSYCTVEPLIAALKDKDKDVRKEAIEALGKTGDSRAINPIIALLKDEHVQLQFIAAIVLDKLGWKAQSTSEKIIFLMAKGNWDECAALGEQTVKPLIVSLKSGYLEAAAPLVKIGKPSIEPLIDILIKDIDLETQKIVTDALVKIGNSAVEPLITILNDINWKHAERAAAVLVKIGSPAIDPLITLMIEGRELIGRKSAAKTLRLLGWRPKNATEDYAYKKAMSL